MPQLSDYFALQPTDKIGREVMSKVENDRSLDGTVSTMRDLYARAYLYYFGQDYSNFATSSHISRGGDQGELAVIRVNHVRALVQTLLNLILSSKIVWEPVATNSDAESAAQTILAAQLLEYYWRDYKVSSFAARALEEAIVFGDAFIYAPWDPSLGDDYAEDPGMPGEDGSPAVPKMIKTGDFAFQNISTWNVIRDPYKLTYEQLDWVIVSTRENRYNLAAKHPELAEKIIQAGSDVKIREHDMPSDAQRDTDDITVYTLFHKRTAALPQGRECVLISDDVVLSDGPLTYDNIPLYRVRAADFYGTPYAYTQFFEVLGIQEMVDSLESAVASNQTTFGAQMIASPMGTDVSPQDFGGMKLLLYPPGTSPPAALQLCKSPPEIFAHIKDSVANMEQLMGLNSVVRGQPQSGDQSGSALALLSNQAKQQSSVLEGDFYRMVRDLGMGIIETMREKGSYPRRLAIAGLANRSLVKSTEYSGKSFHLIHRVQVDIGNPLTQTAAGRKEIADMYLQTLGNKFTPEQLEQVLSTGRLEPLTQSLQQELLLIRSENELLADGKPVTALADDDHVLHMREHRAEMADPMVRQDPTKLQVYMDHQNQHWQLYTEQPPARLMVFGQQPPPMTPPPLPPGPAPGPPPPPSLKPDASSAPPPARLPQMPVDKSTGDRVTQATPGGNS